MGRIPKPWKKSMETDSVICYARKKYSIYIWKKENKKGKKKFIVEPFRKLSNYKRRLFKKEFKSKKKARKFVWSLMKQKEIRGYYTRKN